MREDQPTAADETQAPHAREMSILELQLQHGVNLAIRAAQLEAENAALREALAATMRDRDAARAETASR